jgi:hypothetical protein
MITPIFVILSLFQDNAVPLIFIRNQVRDDDKVVV